jgi:hypothetical protein
MPTGHARHTAGASPGGLCSPGASVCMDSGHLPLDTDHLVQYICATAVRTMQQVHEGPGLVVQPSGGSCLCAQEQYTSSKHQMAASGGTHVRCRCRSTGKPKSHGSTVNAEGRAKRHRCNSDGWSGWVCQGRACLCGENSWWGVCTCWHYCQQHAAPMMAEVVIVMGMPHWCPSIATGGLWRATCSAACRKGSRPLQMLQV